MARIRLARATAATVLAVTCALAVASCDHYYIIAGTEYTGGWTTPLPTGVVSDPDSFRARLTAARGAGHTRQRYSLTCNCDISVRITAVGNTTLIHPDSAPDSGAVVAQMENLNPTNIEAYYGLRPSTDADYYLWVDKRSVGDSARITVIEVPKVHGRSVRAGRQSDLHVCDHHKPNSSHADFAEYRPECVTWLRTRAVPPTPGGGLSWAGLASRVAAKAAYFAEYYARGGWIECNSGCCT